MLRRSRPLFLPNLLRTRSLTCSSQRRGISAYGYTQAKSLVYSKHGEPKDVLSLHTHSISSPGSTSLTLRTLAAPLNPADINQIQGTYPSLPSLTRDLGTTEPSAVPGNEAVFEVVATGPSAKSVQKGDWVIPVRPGLGTWRTHLQVEESLVQRIERENLSKVQAATVGINPVTAYRLLVDFVPVATQGGWVIQNGANSAVGRTVLQLCKKWGIPNIAVVRDRAGDEGSNLRSELEGLGATKVVSEAEVLGSGFAATVSEWTRGSREAVTLALNCVGGKPATALAKVLAPGAHLVTYGAMSRQPMQLPASMLIFRNLVFDGFWVSRWAERNARERRRTVEELLGMMRRGDMVEGPTAEVPWRWESREELVHAVQGTLDGFRKGKGIFIFDEM